MRKSNAPRYSYNTLNQLLTESTTPQEMGDQMDEIMSDLVGNKNNVKGKSSPK